MIKTMIFIALLAGIFALGYFSNDLLESDFEGKGGLSQTALANIREWQQNLVSDGVLPFTQLYVSINGKEKYYYETGLQNPETSTLISRDSISRMYSSTKPVTALAVMILVDRGEILLDAPIYKYLGDAWRKENFLVYNSTVNGIHTFVPCETEITMKMLLTHTSGLSYGFSPATNPVDAIYYEEGFIIGNPFNTSVMYQTLQQIVDELVKMPLLFQPGTAWNYAFGIDVAGRVIEVVTGRGFDDFLQTELFEPLDMQHTGFFLTDNGIDAEKFTSLTVQVSLEEQHATFAPYPDNGVDFRLGTWVSPGAGMITTIDDYIKFTHLILNEGKAKSRQIVSKSSVDLMLTNQLISIDYSSHEAHSAEVDLLIFEPNSPHIDTPVGFGLGGMVSTDRSRSSGFRNNGSYGWGGAAHTTFWVDSEAQIVVVFLTQVLLVDPTLTPVHVELANLIYGALE